MKNSLINSTLDIVSVGFIRQSIWNIISDFETRIELYLFIIFDRD